MCMWYILDTFLQSRTNFAGLVHLFSLFYCSLLLNVFLACFLLSIVFPSAMSSRRRYLRTCADPSSSSSKFNPLDSSIHSFSVLATTFSILYLVLSSITLPNNFSQISPFLSSSPFFPPHQLCPFPAVSKCLDWIPVGYFANHSIFPFHHYLIKRPSLKFFLLLLLAGDIELNPGPYPTTLSSSLNLSHLNIWSATVVKSELDKPAVLQQFLLDQRLDILTLSETWLSTDTPPSVLQSLTPQGYSITHSPRPSGHGGGLATIYRSCFKMSTIALPTFSSFESCCCSFSFPHISSFNITLLTIYRPPSPADSTFITEFATLLEDLATSNGHVIITGDFNIHVNDPNSPSSKNFSILLNDFSLKQHISFPTHSHGNTLDLLITQSSSTIISAIDSTDPSLSDHRAILFSISAPPHAKNTRITKRVRLFRSINKTDFVQDILSSPLSSSTPTSLQSYIHLFDSTLTTILDKHAPFKTITCPSRTNKPFITPEIRAQKSIRSKLETAFRRFRTPESLIKFKTQSKHIAKLISSAKREYYQSLIFQCSKQPKKLWSTLQSLLSRNSSKVLPSSLSASTLSTAFLNFFSEKIIKLSTDLAHNTHLSPHLPPPSPPPSLATFFPANLNEVRQAILLSFNSTCSLDIIPTFLLKSCLDSLLLPITNIINLALSEGTFPTSYKNAIVQPLLKKHNLPHDDLSSYRPISNLNFLSKVLERIIFSRINTHLQTFPLFAVSSLRIVNFIPLKLHFFGSTMTY